MKNVRMMAVAVTMIGCSAINIEGMKIQSKSTEQQNQKPYFDIVIAQLRNDLLKFNVEEGKDPNLLLAARKRNANLIRMIENNIGFLRYDCKFNILCKEFYNAKPPEKESVHNKLIQIIQELQDQSNINNNNSGIRYSNNHSGFNYFGEKSGNRNSMPKQLQLMQFLQDI